MLQAYTFAYTFAYLAYCLMCIFCKLCAYDVCTCMMHMIAFTAYYAYYKPLASEIHVRSNFVKTLCNICLTCKWQQVDAATWAEIGGCTWSRTFTLCAGSSGCNGIESSSLESTYPGSPNRIKSTAQTICRNMTNMYNMQNITNMH